MRVFIVIIFNLFIFKVCCAQIEHPVKWSFAEKAVGNGQVEIFIKATIDGGWHIYGIHEPDSGPVKTTIDFVPAKTFKLIGGIIQPTPITVFEEAFKMNVNYFEKSVVFHQKIMLTSKDAVVSGKVSFMVCNHQKCLPPDEIAFAIPVK